MNNLFNISSSGKVELRAESLSIPPFDQIWARDKSKTKEQAAKEIKYIFFLCDYNSPYRKAYSEVDIERIVKEDFIKDDKWVPDNLIKEGIKKYQELQETSFSRLVNKSLKLADRLSDYMDTIKFVDKDPKDVESTVNMVVKTLKEVGTIIKSLTSLKKQVESDQLETSNVRGKTEINDYELPK